MAELGMVEAAAALGVSVDTIRRRIKAGTLPSRYDERRRLLVTIPDPAEPAARQPDTGAQQRLAGHETLVAGQEAAKPGPVDPRAVPACDESPASPAVDHVRALLDEVRRQRDQLEAQVEAQRRQLEAAEVERAELRRLLALAMQGRALAEPAARSESSEDAREAPAPVLRRVRPRPRGGLDVLRRFLRDVLGWR